MITIKAIEPATVHRIQSGQVIVDLCSVVKELVENSLDAGAANIDVRFRNQGLDAVEVHDNGSGISPENYETLALKHHTSKLATFSDISTLRTFGFRGEALSSLCALSRFSVVTCLAADAPKGTRLEFESSGKLVGASVVAAQKGTTVFVNDLFYNLPVRRRELERNIKREWGKVLVLLNQYACIQTNLNFTVSQQPSKGKRVLLFSTKGNKTTRENIINVFGAKAMAVLIALDVDLELDSTSGPGPRSGQHVAEQKSTTVRVRGFVSRPAHGEGRQTPDRQMFYVNGRPCLLPQFSRVFNEVYRLYNASQSPFILANIELDTHLYDVNVSPDKRTILLHDQARMLERLRDALASLFESNDYFIPTSQTVPSKPMSRTRHASPAGTRGDAFSLRPSEVDLSPLERDALRSDHRDDDSDLNHGLGPPSAKPADPPGAQYRGIASQWTSTSMSSNQVTPPSWLRNDGILRPASPSVRTTATLSAVNPSTSQGQEIKPPSRANVAVGMPLGLLDIQARADCNESSDAEISGTPTETVSGNEEEEPRISTPCTTSSMSISSQPAITGNKLTDIDPGPVAAFEKATITTRNQALNTNSMLGRTGQTKRSRNSPDSHSADGEQPPTRQYTGSSATDVLAHREPIDNKENSDGNEQAAAPGRVLDGSSMPHVDDRDLVTTDHISKYDRPSNDRGIQSYTQSGACSGRRAYNKKIAEAPPSKLAHYSGFTLSAKRRGATLQLVQSMNTEENSILAQIKARDSHARRIFKCHGSTVTRGGFEADDAEETLSLIITKTDFARMSVVGQFNLGFILAVRHGSRPRQPEAGDGNLFIIDQHASDEKYNFERLQLSTTVQPQNLVHPRRLELTALEEEIVRENLPALEANGFKVRFDESGSQPVGSRCELIALPLSRETTFTIADLEELVSLLSDTRYPDSRSAPRPSKVRKMFAMRACRSSIMVGTALTYRQMTKLVRHMGELDKPWNCPHGRPTMRHLSRLSAWDGKNWNEDSWARDRNGSVMNWARYSCIDE
ncbi:DNA mismatch repair protein MutL [Sodiomyces alkalinus F11]|uniref:DNA mismatch repair protein PMS1 n=1 Tax=Sodiomyces alkalinus (strain CBS 110278 / VKM F-3762 / F11) TaxID=1314773 RepID=A0A3N2PJW7_SODAK|nr:DNA mismatch repair protein MutL [Sodiomyces alkalinus F11]ROT34828.1 DNA mismatch repair protein MutL [Sodiomyces alkalinus F11]